MYFILTFFSMFFQFLPRIFALAIGRSLGRIIYYIYPIRKSIALKNLALAFPKYDKKCGTFFI